MRNYKITYVNLAGIVQKARFTALDSNAAVRLCWLKSKPYVILAINIE